MPAIKGPGPELLDLAVIGAGAAGTFVAHHVKRARPEWSVDLFERSERIGGRLWSKRVPGLEHPIELGGMRFLTSHRRVMAVVDAFGLPTHPFDPTGGSELSFLRGRFGSGAADPSAGAGYDLAPDERGRSAAELGMASFARIVPGSEDLDAAGWTRVRATHHFRAKPLTDWSIGDALAKVLSPEGHRFVTDAFGYDSGLRAFNAGDAIEYLLGGGDPSAEARTPNDGMDAIPRALANSLLAAGGTIQLGHELVSHDLVDGNHRLRFANGADLVARRVVVAVPLPALSILSNASPVFGAPAIRRLIDSVEAFPASKLYLWYDRPWWRGDGTALRMTTDLPPKKIFYFELSSDAPAALLAAYTDGQHAEPWRPLVAGATPGSPAPDAMRSEAEVFLRAAHPRTSNLPTPAGSAFSFWGVDPHETGWTFWRPGVRSDDVQTAAIRPDPDVDLFICGETFSRAQAWVEGALETAEAVAGALIEGARG